MSETDEGCRACGDSASSVFSMPSDKCWCALLEPFGERPLSSAQQEADALPPLLHVMRLLHAKDREERGHIIG